MGTPGRTPPRRGSPDPESSRPSPGSLSPSSGSSPRHARPAPLGALAIESPARPPSARQQQQPAGNAAARSPSWATRTMPPSRAATAQSLHTGRRPPPAAPPSPRPSPRPGGRPALPSPTGGRPERPSPARKSDRESRMRELLLAAREEIRRERAESERLRAALAECGAGALAAPGGGAAPPGSAAFAAAQQGRLTCAEAELQQLRAECERLRAAAAAQGKRMEGLRAERDAALAELADFRRRAAVGARRKETPPPPPVLSPPKRRTRGGAAPPPAAAPDAPTEQRGQRRRRRAQLRSQSAPSRPPPRDPSPTAEAVRSERLLQRMRRAFDPPPKETMGILVASMVKELRAMMRRRGVDVPLERCAPIDAAGCAYMLGSKKLHLAVTDGRLVVRSGSGHQDFLEFLSRYLDSAAARSAAAPHLVQWP
eukprot:TRINITY_DN601_c1_g3_i2.p1 TRINITY_DN601_c1_g3~~TRINITY_DN601_c1_g3_i2.p1  ORF type:complete len:451 (+),score=125.21 TRINITY_DN601_c1_g3_i2:74-1354(+)